MIGLGIDFGTSNSAAAWYDGKRVHLVQLEADDAIMPTATHLDRELRTKTGQAAVQQYIEENRDRIVELTPEVVAKSQLLMGDRDIEDPNSEADIAIATVYGQPHVDRGMPGRLFRGVKRLLGNPSIKRLLVFDHPFRLVALITPVLLHIRKRVEATLTEPVLDVHVGHPVKFEGQDELRNQLALSRLGEACQHAGFKTLSFYPEPVAATLSYLHEESAPGQGTVLTVDFGGGPITSTSGDIYLASYDSSGKHRWSKGFGDASSDYGYGVATDSAGNVYLTGYFYGSTSTSYPGVDFGGGTIKSKG